MEFNDSSFCSNSAFAGGGLGVGMFSYGKLIGASRIFTNVAVIGGGAWVDGRLDIVSDDADVFDNTATDGDGGGIYVDTGYLRLFQGDVYRNYANTGGGDLDPSGGGISAVGSFLEMGDGAVMTSNFASWGGGIALMNSTAVLGRARNADAWIHGNTAWRGGGLFATGSHVTVMGLLLTGNGSGGLGTGAGGGAHVIYSTIESDTNAFEINENVIDGRGGGLSLEGSTALLTTVLFGWTPPAGNQATTDGGGLYATNSLIRIANARFTGNSASNGGAAALINSQLVMTNADIFFTPNDAWGSAIAYNQALAEGGAIDARNSDVSLRHVAVVYNASQAGPIHFTGPKMLALKDSIVADNDSYGGWGAITLLNSATGWLYNCTVYSNGNTFNTCYGIYGDGSAGITMSHSILWKHGNGSISNGGAGAFVQSSLIEGGRIGGNLTVDPQLYSSTYHLKYSSPCIDAGVAWGGADVDIDGEARSGNYDLGADEWQDSDGDMLPDTVESDTGTWWDETSTGTNPGNPDTDGDNVGDGEEWFADTDPNSIDSYLGFLRIWQENGTNRVQWKGGQAAAQYVEYVAPPAVTNWTLAASAPPPTPITNSAPLSLATNLVTLRIRAVRP